MLIQYNVMCKLQICNTYCHSNWTLPLIAKSLVLVTTVMLCEENTEHGFIGNSVPDAVPLNLAMCTGKKHQFFTCKHVN